MTLLTGPVPSALANDCAHVESGVDPNLANSSGGVILGEAVGQTFHADALLIESITVWRVAYEDTNQFGMHVYVTATDSLGRPNSRQVLASGPDVYHLFGDGTHPIEFEFVFDPPLSLPSIGNYYFTIQSVPCYGFWDLAAVDGLDYYPAGHAWANSRSLECTLSPFAFSYPSADLCFRIRYCDISTPTQRTTWGHLKAIYR